MSSWSGVSQAYRDSFALLCAGTEQRILDDLQQGPLLDAGSGTGSLTRVALHRGLEATAIDADPDMVAMTNEAAPGRCSLQALPRLAFEDATFPSVAANFVINHLPDPRAGVRELTRVASPGGLVAVTIWPAGGAGWAPMVNRAFEVAGATPLDGTRLEPHLDFPRTVDGLAQITTEAGLTVITAETLTWQWHVPAGSLWAGISGGVASPGARYLAQSSDVQRQIEREFHALAAESSVDNELSFECSAAYVVARR
ncbi:hypothetical protein GCM10027030_27480 [Luteococcus sediminum]